MPTMNDAISAHPQYALAGLLGWVALYMIYRVVWHRDFGMPVQRRLSVFGLRVERDQIAYVPFWWTDLQVQRALDAHWQRTMRQAFDHRSMRSLR